MPIYEYLCDCTKERQERVLPFSECDQPQICKCGKVMLRVMSVPSAAIFTPTARGMALDTLNDKHGGMSDKRRTPYAEQMAAAGL